MYGRFPSPHFPHIPACPPSPAPFPFLGFPAFSCYTVVRAGVCVCACGRPTVRHRMRTESFYHLLPVRSYKDARSTSRVPPFPPPSAPLSHWITLTHVSRVGLTCRGLVVEEIMNLASEEEEAAARAAADKELHDLI